MQKKNKKKNLSLTFFEYIFLFGDIVFKNSTYKNKNF